MCWFEVVSGVASVGNATTASGAGTGRNATLTSLFVCCAFIACWSPNEVTWFLNFFGYSVDFSGWFYHFTSYRLYETKM